jgi:hypothetical protein
MIQVSYVRVLFYLFPPLFLTAFPLTAQMAGETRFLMRTDLAAFTAEALDPGSKSHVLGLELDASLIWAPFSDLGLSA